MIVVSDTSPLSYLSKLERLNLLPRIFGEVMLPPGVLAEWDLDQAADSARELAQQSGWLKIVAPENETAVADLQRWIDRGEAEAIVLAQELNADLLLMDDGDGREMAEQRGLKVTGVLGVLLRAKRSGLIPAIRPDLERLLNETNFFCSATLIQSVLTLAGE